MISDHGGEQRRRVVAVARPRGKPKGPDLAHHGLDQLRGAEQAGEAQQARRAGPVWFARMSGAGGAGSNRACSCRSRSFRNRSTLAIR